VTTPARAESKVILGQPDNTCNGGRIFLYLAAALLSAAVAIAPKNR